MKFGLDQTTDQKRLARAEQWLVVRKFLRTRDEVHNRPWRLMILAGGNPAEEIQCIRELMTQAHITAIDREIECVRLALDSGANAGKCCELIDADSNEPKLSMEAASLEKFDAVFLDLCSNVNRTTKNTFKACRGLVSGGMMVYSFAVGRDVVEMFEPNYRNYSEEPAFVEMVKAGVADSIMGRLAFLFGGQMFKCQNGGKKPPHPAHSVISYLGNKTPMVSVAAATNCGRFSYIKLSPGDFELAVTCPDPTLMYACPQERIEQLRRTNAAIKAWYTAKTKSKEPE